MIRILFMAFLLAAFADTAASQSDEDTADPEVWDAYVVYEETVASFTLDGQPREFAGQILIQFDENESACTVAILDSYAWSDEFVQRWNQAKRNSEPMHDLWRDMPAPTKCWTLDDASMTARHSGSAAWDCDLETVLVGSITGSVRHMRAIHRKLDPAKPEWWPSQYALSEYRPNEYGNVMPGQDAVYYLSSGERSESDFDVWGEIPRYEGPGKFVIRTKGVDDDRLAVFTLDILGIHSGHVALVSSDGQWAVVFAPNEHTFWILDLRKAWPALQDEESPDTEQEEPNNDGD